MSFKNYVSKTKNKVKEQTAEAVDYFKTSYRKKQLNDSLGYLYKTLGQIRYEELRLNQGITDHSMKVFDEIVKANNELADLIRKSDDGIVKNLCCHCKKKIPEDILYCPYCGREQRSE